MALLPTNNRDKVLALVGLISAAVAAYYILNVWQPKNDDLNEKQLHVDSLVISNQRAKAELAQGRTNELKAEAARLTEDLEVMRRLVPLGNEVPALLDQVSTAARRVGLDIADVQPLPMLSGDQYDAYKYRLSVRGAYHQIAVLLTNIGSLQRIVAPINLTLTPSPVDAKAVSKAKTQPLDARFEIQTYVARMTVAAPTVVKGATKEAPKPGEK